MLFFRPKAPAAFAMTMLAVKVRRQAPAKA